MWLGAMQKLCEQMLDIGKQIGRVNPRHTNSLSVVVANAAHEHGK
jgi:hypothetical protein